MWKDETPIVNYPYNYWIDRRDEMQETKVEFYGGTLEERLTLLNQVYKRDDLTREERVAVVQAVQEVYSLMEQSK